MSHDNLMNFYKTLFALVHHYHYSLSDLENMPSYELDVFQDLLAEHQKKVLEEQSKAAGVESWF